MANTYKIVNLTGGGGSDDRRVKVSTDDTGAGFLEEKVLAESSKVVITTENPGAIELLKIDVDQTQIDHDQLLNFVADEHVPKDDTLTTTDNLWSASKTQTELDLKADITYVDAQDTATLNSANSYTDTEVATRVAKAGDTMTGNLNINNANLNISGASGDTTLTQTFLDIYDALGQQGATVGQDTSYFGKYVGATQPYIELNYGGTRAYIKMYDTLTTNPSLPVDPDDVVVKKYTDDQDAATLTSANDYTDAGLATKADLVGGKVPSSQIPAIAITDVFVVADIAARDALTIGTGDGEVQEGDVSIVLDNGSGDREAYIYDGTQWQTLDTQNFNTLFATKTTTDLAEGTNLYFTDERAQDSIGTILVDTASIDFTYDDATPQITAVVLPAGVDHDALNNFVANEHIDHTSVSISAGEGLTGGGDISASRTISVNIPGLTSAPALDTVNDDLIIYDASEAGHRKIKVSEISSIGSSDGDLSEGSFAIAESAPGANVTGFSFANATVRSFKAQVSVSIDATSDLFEVFDIQGIQKGSDWEISILSDGDDSLISFDISSLGQITYSSSTYAGFASGTIKYRAEVTTI